MSANPIQIVPIHGAALEAPAKAPSLTYRGGPMLTAVQVFNLFWGDAWQQNPQAAIAMEVDQFFDYVLTSPLLDQLSEYSVSGSAIGPGSRLGSLVVTNPVPPASLADGDIQSFIQRQLSSGSGVPQPTASSLYFVFLPPNVSVSLGGATSCTNFCGYHSDVSGSLFYAVMPFPGCSGCTGGLSVIDALTSTTSHELCEAITDPVPGQGWYDDSNGEIGDICAWQTKKLGVYTVQMEWSNSAGRCI